MKECNIIKHYTENGESIEDIIFNYFSIYLDINKSIYE